MSIRDMSAPLPKHAPEYLSWLHSLPSGASGLVGVIAHHRIGGRYSQHKTSDYEAMPLTDLEHRQLHASMEDFVKAYGKTEKEILCDVLLEAIRQGVLVLDKKAAKELS
jgi:hypothetical protein